MIHLQGMFTFCNIHFMFNYVRWKSIFVDTKKQEEKNDYDSYYFKAIFETWFYFQMLKC